MYDTMRVYCDAVDGVDLTWPDFMESIGQRFAAKQKDWREGEIAAVHKEASELSRQLTVTTRWFVVTVRPIAMSLIDLREAAEKLAHSSLVVSATWSYEQKGELAEGCGTLGQGSHFHMVLCTNKYKSDVVARLVGKRAILSRHMPHGIGHAGVDVKASDAERAARFVRDYLVEYKSADGHKEKTKDADAEWRKQNGLRDLYTFGV